MIVTVKDCKLMLNASDTPPCCKRCARKSSRSARP